jgi:F-type H+-transporting ATPase subunit alpha
MLKQLAEPLRLDYAQFLELELFSRFGAAPDARVAAQLEHGKRIRVVLQQSQYVPASLAGEVAMLTALTKGALDAMPLDSVAGFRTRLEAVLGGSLGPQAREIDGTGTLSAEDSERFAAAIVALAAAP